MEKRCEELMDDIKRGDIDAVRKTVEGVPGIANIRARGTTPLFIASGAGNLAAVDLLISHGADVNALNDYGASPLFAASYSGNIELVRFLLDHGADPDNSRKSMPILAASQENRIEVLRLLIDRGASVTASKTPLLRACQNGCTEIVELLVGHGAPVNRVSKNGDTPLAAAIRNGHRGVCLFLASRTNADIDQASKPIRNEMVFSRALASPRVIFFNPPPVPLELKKLAKKRVTKIN